MEAHHSKLISEMCEGEQTRIEDLIMICPNCHSMIHGRSGIGRDNLKDIVYVALCRRRS